jgi:hypothetical protein
LTVFACMGHTTTTTTQGASLQQKNSEGLTARSLAFNNNHVRIVTLIDNTARLLQEEEGEHATPLISPSLLFSFSR